MKNIAVIGTGGVGGYFGGKLSQLKKDDGNIFFIARGKHLEEINKNGLTLKTSDEGTFECKPTLATDDIADLPLLDLCIICVKSFSLTAVLNDLKSKITDSTVIIPLLNGIDIASRVRDIITNGVLLPACVYVGTHIERAGVVSQKGGACTIHIGNERGTDNGSPQWILSLLKDAQIKYIWHDDVYPEIWSKFSFICSYGTTTACFNKSVGEVMSDEKLSILTRTMINEIVNIAEAMKVKLPDDISEMTYNKGNSFPFETKTSFQRDFEIPDKQDERDLFAGTLVRLGKQNRIDCSTTEMLLTRLNEIKQI